MRRLFALACAVGASVALTQIAAADPIVWSQTTNLPKGLNMPPGQVFDILGVAPGDTIADVRAKLAALASANAEAPKVEELDATLTAPTPGGSIEATYPSVLRLTLLSGTNRNTEDKLEIGFSAPSSGSQVISIDRTIEYYLDKDQVRLSELLAGLTAKYGFAPQLALQRGSQAVYRFEFNDGAVFAPAKPEDPCNNFAKTWSDEGALNEINPQGTCDVVLNVTVSFGLSTDLLRSVAFELADNERAKADLRADYDYFHDFVAKTQKTGGSPTPAL